MTRCKKNARIALGLSLLLIVGLAAIITDKKDDWYWRDLNAKVSINGKMCKECHVYFQANFNALVIAMPHEYSYYNIRTGDSGITGVEFINIITPYVICPSDKVLNYESWHDNWNNMPNPKASRKYHMLTWIDNQGTIVVRSPNLPK